jgi:hypothetical protein
VQNSFEWWVRDNSLVKCAFLSNVRNDGKAQVTLFRCVCVICFDLVRFLLRSNSRHNRMTALQKDIKGMRSNEAAAAGKEYSCHCQGSEIGVGGLIQGRLRALRNVRRAVLKTIVDVAMHCRCPHHCGAIPSGFA